MSEETPNFRPQDLLEQSGPNMGNMSSGELVGITADQHKEKIDEFLAGGNEISKDYIKISEPTNPIYHKEEDRTGNEIRRRAVAFAKEKGVSPAAVDAFGDKAVADFYKEQDILTKKRVRAELDQLSQEAGLPITEDKGGEKTDSESGVTT